jgi:hypothetical protein
LDYSQRTNKLAHHIVVDGPMPTCGPAALLAESGVMRDHWDGQCVNVPSAPALPALSAEPGVCRTWESITGDAGWGGVVANAWLSSSPRPVFILFGEDQSTELLVLLHESLALLPSNKRWQATFGTYVTTLPPDVECRVRCVLSGSDEARMASARGTVIDLTSPLGQAASSDAVHAARSGGMIGAESETQKDYRKPIESIEQFDKLEIESNNIHEEEPTNETEDLELRLEAKNPIPPPSLKKSAKLTDRKAMPKESNFSNSTKLLALSCSAMFFLIALGVYYSGFIGNLSGIDVGYLHQSTDTETKKPHSKPEKETQDVDPSPSDEMGIPTSKQAKMEVSSNPEKKTSVEKQIAKEKFSRIKNSLEISLKNLELPLKKPLAISGTTIQAEVKGKDTNLAQGQLDDLSKILPFAEVSWKISKNGKDWNLIAKQDVMHLKIEQDFIGRQIKMQIACDGENLESEIMTVRKNAEPKDFSVTIAGVVKSKKIPFAITDFDVSCDLAAINTDRDLDEYLQHVAENPKYGVLITDHDGNVLRKVELGGTNSTTISQDFTKQFTGREKQVRAFVILSDGLNIESKESIPLIQRLDVKLSVNNKFSTLITFSGKHDQLPEFACKYNHRQLSDHFDIRDIIDFESVANPDLKSLESLCDCLTEIKEGIRKLDTDFESLQNIAKESLVAKDSMVRPSLFKAFLDDFKKVRSELKPETFFLLKKDNFSDLSLVIDELYQLIQLNEGKDIPQNPESESVKISTMRSFISMKNHPMPNDSDDIKKFKAACEKRQNEFLDWYRYNKVQNQTGLSVFKKGIYKLHDLINRLRELRSVVSINKSFLIEKPVGDFSVSVQEPNDLESRKKQEDLGSNKPILKRKLPIVLVFSLFDESNDLQSRGAIDSSAIPELQVAPFNLKP